MEHNQLELLHPSPLTSLPYFQHSQFFGGAQLEYIKSFAFYDYCIAAHSHGFWEINIILSGKGRHFIENQSYDVSVGSVFVIPPNIAHGYTNDGGLTVHHLLTHRDFFSHYDDLKSMPGFALLFEIEPFLRSRFHKSINLLLSDKELSRTRSELAIIDDYMEGNRREKEQMINIAALNLFTYWCFLIETRSSPHRSLDNAPSLLPIVTCLSYIHHNYDEEITVDRLAELAQMSRSAFYKEFKAVCKLPPYEYIFQYRIAKAREMMKNTDMSINAVALACGFCDGSHLIKRMKKEGWKARETADSI